MSLPVYIAAAVPIVFILLINVWWERHWKLRNLPTPVCFFGGFYALALSFKPILACRLVPLSFGAMKSSSSKTTKATYGVPGSKNAVELSRSKQPGATQKS